MAIRVFTCRNCGHKMRLGGDCCGKCNETKQTHQRLYFYVVPMLILLVGLPSVL